MKKNMKKNQPNMKKMSSKFFVWSLLFLGCNLFSVARPNVGINGGRIASPTNVQASGCLPATAQIDLDLNNIRLRILGGGDMWWDLIGQPRYEIPKNSRKHSLFAASVWIGGIDAGGQLKVAAMTYRQTGNDYWPGPLDYNTNITPEGCQFYDRHWKISRKEVQDFVAAQNGAPPDGYSGPSEAILSWPGNFNVNLVNPNQNSGIINANNILAPFEDVDGDFQYRPEESGDYPRFDFSSNAGSGNDCNRFLYGDQLVWWVFNDAGNLHTETSANALGVEVRAQAFAFSTNDEINNMSFYQYEIHNKSSFTVNNTYMAYWVDPDLGNYIDDYIGSDVKQGLGFCYNSTDFDPPNGENFYADKPPAVGLDFFLGPAADTDSLDNPISETNNGTGYGDGIIDNERLGMEICMYYINNATIQGNPNNGSHVYNYMRALWKDGTPLTYGGNGYNSGTPTKYAFPWDTDPNFAGNPWQQSGAAADLRIVESAGPFTLQPGAVNYITTGAVWAQAQSGGALASVVLMKAADIKAQALFDNCFKVLNGPDAPDVTYQELDKELLIYLTNSKSSNNYREQYVEKDPTIILPGLSEDQKNYRFQGYRIFQLRNENVSVSQLSDPQQAREVIQCDLKDDVTRIMNYEFDATLGAAVPKIKVEGKNEGIKHTFRITTDAFSGANLINFKQYYFTAVAYAYNNFKTFDPIDPNALDGQKLPYKEGRLNIRTYTLIPHPTAMKEGGTIAQSLYGMSPEVTRIEGQGNGGNVLDLSQETIDKILAAGEDHSARIAIREIKYATGNPIGVKIIDPLNVPKGKFKVKFMLKTEYAPEFINQAPPAGIGNTVALRDTIVDLNSNMFAVITDDGTTRTFGRISSTPAFLDKAWWSITGNLNGKDTTIMSDTSIAYRNEQLFPAWGLSLYTGQVEDPGSNSSFDNNGFQEATITFSDNTNQWLTGVRDDDGNGAENWVRSGTYQATEPAPNGQTYNDWRGFDDGQVYESVLNGTWAPFRLTSDEIFGPNVRDIQVNTTIQSSPLPNTHLFTIRNSRIQNLASVDVVITSDKTKWTRCPVFEMSDLASVAEGGASKLDLRAGKSVDKEGKSSNDTTPSSDPNSPNYIGSFGYGWFPGYAINIETGERLNMAFGENSQMTQDNGRDMIWNPTDRRRTATFDDRFGGFHYIYVFGHNYDVLQSNPTTPPLPTSMPAYDSGKFIWDKMRNKASSSYSLNKQLVLKDAIWVGFPLLVTAKELLSSDVKVRLRVNKPYRKFYSARGEIKANSTAEATAYDTLNTNLSLNPQNANFPLYEFSTDGLETLTNQNTVAKNALELVRAVPNPYFAYSEYELTQLDNRIRIVNLPEKCTVSIYTTNGTLIRKINKDDVVFPYIEWDLKNQANVPIAGGLYYIHVNVPGVGEKVIKWFGVLRPIDLDSF